MMPISSIRLPGERPPQMPVIVRCKTCGDTGLIRVDGEPPAENGSESEIWRAFMPCICELGDQTRRGYEWHVNRPMCPCGREAIANGFGPRCEQCEPIEVAKWRARSSA